MYNLATSTWLPCPLFQTRPRLLCCTCSSSSSRINSGDNGWALSERSRVAKSLDSLRVRQNALIIARESRTVASLSPGVSACSTDVGPPVKGGGCGGAPPVTGGGRKRPRPVEDAREQSGNDSGEMQPLPLSPSSPLGSCRRFGAIDER